MRAVSYTSDEVAEYTRRLDAQLAAATARAEVAEAKARAADRSRAEMADRMHTWRKAHDVAIMAANKAETRAETAEIDCRHVREERDGELVLARADAAEARGESAALRERCAGLEAALTTMAALCAPAGALAAHDAAVVDATHRATLAAAKRDVARALDDATCETLGTVEGFEFIAALNDRDERVRAAALREAEAACGEIQGTHRNAEADADDPEYHEAAGDGAESCALAVRALAAPKETK